MTGRAEIARLRRRLDNSCMRVAAVDDLEAQSDFARYLCILVSGYLENALVELLLEHIRTRSTPPIRSFIQSRLDRVTNVHPERLLQLMGAFDMQWRAGLETFIAGEREAAIASLIALRNNIAHGGTSGVSYARVMQYYKRVDEVVEFLTDLLDPVSTLSCRVP